VPRIVIVIIITREQLDPVPIRGGCLPYCSPHIQNELINPLGARVRQTIISPLKKARCCSIIFDTTPDNAHVEQMSQIVRSVDIQRGCVEIKETFISFISLYVEIAEIITAEIRNKVGRGGLNLEACTGLF
jgi:hypothetical protein